MHGKIATKAGRHKKIQFKIARRWLALGLLVFLLPALICFAESLRYPRIARSAYWRCPLLLAKATVARLCANGGVASRTVIADAERLGYRDGLSVRLQYLPDVPRNDKTIRDRVFAMIGKWRAVTNERLFWVVTPGSGGSIINDDTLVYEYKTGRLVYCEDFMRTCVSTAHD